MLLINKLPTPDLVSSLVPTRFFLKIVNVLEILIAKEKNDKQI